MTGLGSEVHHLLLQGHHLDNAVDEGDLEVGTLGPDGVEGTQAGDDVGPGLGHDAHNAGQQGKDYDGDDNDNQGWDQVIPFCSLLLVFGVTQITLERPIRQGSPTKKARFPSFFSFC